MLLVAATVFVTRSWSPDPPSPKASRISLSPLQRLIHYGGPYRLCRNVDIPDEEFKRQLHPGILLTRPDWVNTADLGDPISDLMVQLHTEDRNVAVRHYLKNNKYEVTLISTRMKSALNLPRFIALGYQRHPPHYMIASAITPLVTHVRSYVDNRRGRCLYDSVPTGLREPEKYDGMFKDLNEISFKPGDVDGIYAYLRDPSSLHVRNPLRDDTSASVDPYSGLIKINSTTDGIRFLNPANGCACRVSDSFRSVSLSPKHRSLFAVDNTSGYFWRVDSKVAAVVQVPAHSEVGLLATDDFSLMGYHLRESTSALPIPRLRRLYGGCPLAEYLATSPFSRLPGMVKFTYSGDQADVAHAFKVSNDLGKPVVVEDVERVVVPGRGFDLLELPLEDGLGVPMTWDHLHVFDYDGGLRILCDSNVQLKLMSLSDELKAFTGSVDSFKDLFRETELYRTNGAVITGFAQDDSVKLNERQMIMQQVFKAYREGNFSEVVRLLKIWGGNSFSLHSVFAALFNEK